MMKWNNLTQMERNALFAFGVPDKKDTINRLNHAGDIAMKRDVKEMLWQLADKLGMSSVTEHEYQNMLYTVKHRKELVLIRTTAAYQEQYDDPEANRPWSALAKVMLVSIFSDFDIRMTIEMLAELREYMADEALRVVTKELVDDLRDMEYLTPELFVDYLIACRNFNLEHNFKSDEEILSRYKDGGYSGRLA